MNSVSSIAVSGMNAAMLRMDVAANNVANSQTDGYRRQFVAQQAQPDGGVLADVGELQQPGENLADDIVQQMIASFSFKANVRSFQAEQSMLGSLLDLTA